MHIDLTLPLGFGARLLPWHDIVLLNGFRYVQRLPRVFIFRTVIALKLGVVQFLPSYLIEQSSIPSIILRFKLLPQLGNWVGVMLKEDGSFKV